ncbi:hypothetical protein SMC26_19910 [Actinomadura fulvescens]|uniref:hypothetical protein n=1 Tax=Actinomadura fulvescens TaxID=46160 RepID=UPI0031DC4237
MSRMVVQPSAPGASTREIVRTTGSGEAVSSARQPARMPSHGSSCARKARRTAVASASWSAA